ncbi:MAG TPA: dipicolinate synthase subunit B [Clostridiales bacterium]|nr:dipicolinate synthase subunit B [Clostridiales bacterium]
MIDLKGVKIAFVMTGSFCTFDKAFKQARILKELGAELIPVMSFNSYSLNTRFGVAEENVAILEEICGRKVIATIEDAEPIGPKKMADIMIVAPCTGNTLAKLAMSITDTPATMAVKSHIRNSRPVVLAVSTNDALAGSCKNLGSLMNVKNYYFVPLTQDDYASKPTSLVSDYELIPLTIQSALHGNQLQPILN